MNKYLNKLLQNKYLYNTIDKIKCKIFTIVKKWWFCAKVIFGPLRNLNRLFHINNNESYLRGQNDVIWQHYCVNGMTHLTTPVINYSDDSSNV